MRRENYFNTRSSLRENYLNHLTIHLEQRVLRYTQYYGYNEPVLSRRLQNIEVSTETKITDQEPSDNIFFQIFYTISQLGGLLSFLSWLLGFVLYPTAERMLKKEAIEQLIQKEGKLFELNLYDK